MTLLSIADAAERLGVSARQARNLVVHGDLRLVARGLVDATSVDRLVAVRRGSHTRAWSEGTAWGAVALLSGMDAAWMGDSQRSRLRARLRAIQSEELVERTRGRADVQRYAGHSSSVGRLRAEVVDTTASAARLGLAATASVDGYLARSDLASIVARHGLIEDESGTFALRATGFHLDVVAELAERGDALAALDLAESLDIREQRAGLDGIARALDAFRG